MFETDNTIKRCDLTDLAADFLIHNIFTSSKQEFNYTEASSLALVRKLVLSSFAISLIIENYKKLSIILENRTCVVYEIPNPFATI